MKSPFKEFQYNFITLNELTNIKQFQEAELHHVCACPGGCKGGNLPEAGSRGIHFLKTFAYYTYFVFFHNDNTISFSGVLLNISAKFNQTSLSANQFFYIWLPVNDYDLIIN